LSPCALRSFPTRRSSDLTALRVVRISVLSGPIGRRRSLPALSRQPYTGLLSRRKTQVLAQSREHALRFGDAADAVADSQGPAVADRKSTRLNSSHVKISY